MPLDARVQTGADLVRPYDAAPPSALRRGPARRHRPAGAARDRHAPGGERPGRRRPARRRSTRRRCPRWRRWGDTVGRPRPRHRGPGPRRGAAAAGHRAAAGPELRIATPGAARDRGGDRHRARRRRARAERRAAGRSGGRRRPGGAWSATSARSTAARRRRHRPPPRRPHRSGCPPTRRPAACTASARAASTGRCPPDAWRSARSPSTARPSPRRGAGWSGPGLTAGQPAGPGRPSTTASAQGAAVLTARAGGPGDAGDPVPVAVDPATAAAARDGLARPRAVRRAGHGPGRRRAAPLPDRHRTLRRARPRRPRPARRRLDARASPSPASCGWTSRLAGWAALADPPFDQLARAAARAARGVAAGGPVARGAAELLAWAAAVTLLAGAAALVLLVAAERHDDAAAEYAWEADGVPPATLRAALWWRAVAVAVPAAPAGILGGVVARRAHRPAGGGHRHGHGRAAAAGRGRRPAARQRCWPSRVLVVALAAAAALAAASLREPLPRRRLGTPA